jgi:lipid A 3-O-deacylase
MNLTSSILLITSLILFNSDHSLAEPNPKEGSAVALYIENDSRNVAGPGSDQAYTNGIKFAYIYANNQIPDWAKKTALKLNFFDAGISSSKVNFGLSLGHQIFSPNNTYLTELIPDDRPYAGWLYAGFAVSLKKDDVAQFFEFDIGIIGPSALGKQVQNNFHDLIRTRRAEGWQNSLHDEPTLQLYYQKRFKYFKSKNLDFFPYYGAAFGNVNIGAHVGSLIRIGINLPDDFGPSRPSASDGDSFVSPINHALVKESGYYGFVGARGSAMARNIFLDGNTFQKSHRVEKKPFVLETEFGFGLVINPFSFVWRFVTHSVEFDKQTRLISFASLNFVYSF